MENLQQLAKKITYFLLAAQAMASAGFIAVATLNPIVGQELSGHAGWAGVPAAVYLLAGALSAYVWGILNEKLGRRGGLALGLSMGVLGSGIAFRAVWIASFPLFLFAMIFMGFAQSASQLARFAAAEVHPPRQRGRAISNVVIGGTFGSILGPTLVGPTGEIARRLVGNELAGAYGASLLLFVVAVAVIATGLRPDPREIGKAVAREHPQDGGATGPVRSLAGIFAVPAARLALLAMVFGQLVMVLVMVITSLHMKNHQHPLGDISLVISSHTFGMFAFSIISGRLADRFGRGPIILFGSATLILACLAATLSPDVLPLGVALFLLGLGWNFCFVGGSTLLSDQLTVAERARTQGFNDLLVGLASAVGSLGSGLIFAAVGYEAMALVAGGLALIPLTAAIVWLQRRKTSLQPASGS